MATLPELETANVVNWLQVKRTGTAGLYHLKFADRHIGNPWIRSIHGGVSGSFMEVAAQMEVLGQLPGGSTAYTSSNSTDYLRATRDADIYARVTIVRISRRLAMVDVWCWQDDENEPITHATITLRIHRPD